MPVYLQIECEFSGLNKFNNYRIGNYSMTHEFSTAHILLPCCHAQNEAAFPIGIVYERLNPT
jgi:hypothetical protein